MASRWIICRSRRLRQIIDHFHARAIARRRKARFRLRMCRILFAAKHSWTALSISRPLFVGSYLQVRWWAFGQWKGKKNASNDNNNSGSVQPFICRTVFKTIYNKTIIGFGFCDVLNDQGWGKCYQPQPSARLVTLTSTLIIPDITKTSSNNCLQTHACPIATRARAPHDSARRRASRQKVSNSRETKVLTDLLVTRTHSPIFENHFGD